MRRDFPSGTSCDPANCLSSIELSFVDSLKKTMDS